MDSNIYQNFLNLAKQNNIIQDNILKIDNLNYNSFLIVNETDYYLVKKDINQKDINIYYGDFNIFFNDDFQPKNYSIKNAIVNNENYQNIIPSILYNSQILSDDENNNVPEDYTIQKLLNMEIFPLKILLYDGNLSIYNEVSDIQFNGNLYLGTEYTDLSSITVLKDGCYSCNSQISSIIIPENVISIEQNSFMNDFNLRDVKIKSNSLYQINQSTFENCINLSAIEMPDSIKELGYEAFYNCYKLKSIKLPKKLKRIYNNCFSNCSSLISIDIPDGVTEIGNKCFENCYSLKLITIPSNINKINQFTLNNCINLRYIIIFNRNEVVNVDYIRNYQKNNLHVYVPDELYNDYLNYYGNINKKTIKFFQKISSLM